ncbi:hypothetical protein HYY75_13065, partial [bacterium]|nr:hypothetical protein [bacterium]
LVKNIRVRGTNSECFAELSINLQNDLPLEQAHGLSHQVESAIKEKHPRCHVQIHIEPFEPKIPDLFSQIRRLALFHHGISNIHGLEIREEGSQKHIVLHLEIGRHFTLEAAHQNVSNLESKILVLDKSISRIVTHIEPSSFVCHRSLEVTEENPEIVRNVTILVENFPPLSNCHGLKIFKIGSQLSMDLHARVPGNTTVIEAHRLSETLEQKIRTDFPNFANLIIHIEPLKLQ